MLRKSRKKRGHNTIVVAMVALYEPCLPSPDRYRHCLEQNFSDLPPILSVSLTEKDDLNVEMRSAEKAHQIDGLISLMPFPIPWSDLEGPCSTAWWWPEAAEKLKHHTAHAIVTLLKRTDDIITNSLIVTKLAACLASTANSAGVYWGAGTVVHPPEGFMELSIDATPDNLPLPLWMDFRVLKSSDEKHYLLTTGLEGLNKREIEIAPCALPPTEVMDLGYDLAHYVLTTEAKIKDGDTFGRSATEKIRIKFARSMWDRAEEVMRLEMQ